MLFNRHFIWPSFYYNDFFPMVELTKGSSLSVKAQGNDDEVVYDLKLPEGFDQKSIKATVEGDVLRVVVPKQKPVKKVDNEIEIKGV